MINVHFITFGDGSQQIREAAARLSIQAMRTKWFRLVNKFHERDLKELSNVWYKNNINFIKNNSRGYGYWIWKPFLIFECLKKIQRNDILIYADAGYEIDPTGLEHLMMYLKLVHEHGLLGFELNHQNHRWCKADTLNYFGLEKNLDFLNAKQREAGLLLFSANSLNVGFLSAWTELVTAQNYHLVDDSKSILPELKSFIEHRHDQSIFSILTELLGIGHFIPFDHYHPELWKKGMYRKSIPFHSMRNKTGREIIKSTLNS